MNATNDRSFLIARDGLHNLRAVQGYAGTAGARMRPGRLYRSGAWERMSEADRAWLRTSIETVIDLRHPDEVADAARGRLGAPPATVVYHSIFRPDMPMAAFIAELNALHGSGIGSARYLNYLKVGAAERFARTIEMLAEEHRYPVLINCTAGKDRTGILIAVVMELLDVDDEMIAAEYERSNAAIDGLIAYLEQIGRKPAGTRRAIRARARVSAETMLEFLAGVRAEFGSVRGLLASQGVTDETIEALRHRLLE